MWLSTMRRSCRRHRRACANDARATANGPPAPAPVPVLVLVPLPVPVLVPVPLPEATAGGIAPVGTVGSVGTCATARARPSATVGTVGTVASCRRCGCPFADAADATVFITDGGQVWHGRGGCSSACIAIPKDQAESVLNRRPCRKPGCADCAR